MAGVGSSVSEMDLDRPNIAEYLTTDSIDSVTTKLHLRDLPDISPILTDRSGTHTVGFSHCKEQRRRSSSRRCEDDGRLQVSPISTSVLAPHAGFHWRACVNRAKV